jgi:hypothetical protein
MQQCGGKDKAVTFIEQQNAAEHASRLAAAKVSSVKNVECDWVIIGACFFPSSFNGPSLICCKVAGCKVLIHHACQAEWENGGPGWEAGPCNKFCVAHHPAAKPYAVVERPVARATRAMMMLFLKKLSQHPLQGA